MSKHPREFYLSQPERYRIERGGAVKDLTTNRWVDALEKENPHAITKATSQQMHQLRKAQKLRSEVLGRIDAAREFAEEKKLEITIPDPDMLTEEELIKADGDADRLVTKLFTLAFLKTASNTAQDGKNFRGLAEGYAKVKGVEDPRTREPEAPRLPGTVSLGVDTLFAVAAEIERLQAAALERSRAVDAESWAGS